MSDDESLLCMPRLGQMAQEMVRPNEEPPWWQVALPKEFGVAGTNVCRWCFGLYDRPRRSLAEVEQLRRVLKVDMTVPFDPPICQSCYENVVSSAVTDEKLVPGSSNHGPRNMLLG